MAATLRRSRLEQTTTAPPPTPRKAAARRTNAAAKRVWLEEPSPRKRLAAARAWASAQGFGLQRIDLGTIVSRYIGETEKNLSRVFAEAAAASAALFFDEADALFGRRTDVKDSHDRWANSVTDTLVRKLETAAVPVVFAGRKATIDPGFLRRLRLQAVSLPTPSVATAGARAKLLRSATRLA